MNPPDPLSPEDTLPLPSPDSPKQLDQTILSYARDNAPPRQRSLQPAWISAVAAACIMGVALFISMPEPPGPNPSMDGALPEQAIETARTLQRETSPRTDGQQLPAAKAQARKPAAVAPDTNPYPAAYPGHAADEPAGLMAKEHENSAMDTDRAEATQAIAAPAEATDQTAILRSQIERCTQLLAAGNEQQARQCYLKLHRHCPHCQLPDSLEEASERYLNY